MKTLEEKKKEKLQKRALTKELEEHLNSKEMQDLLKELEKMEKYVKKTQKVSV